MLNLPLYVSLFVSMASFWTAYQPATVPDSTRWILIFGGLWAFGQWRRWHWFASLGLFATLFLAVLGAWLELSAGWLVLGMLTALFTWDLSDVIHRAHVSAPDDVHLFQKRHLLRLVILSVVGLSFSLILMLVHREVSSEWVGYFAILSALWIALRMIKARQGNL